VKDTSQVPMHGYQFDTLLKKYLLNLHLITIINDIHVCEDTNHVNAIFRTGPWATYTILMTPTLD